MSHKKIFWLPYGFIQKVYSLRREVGGEGGEGVIEKWTKTNREKGVLACVYGHFLIILFSTPSIIFFAYFQEKKATYSLVIDNVYFVISS